MEENLAKGLTNIWDKVGNWVTEFIAMLPNILIAAVILILGLFVAKKVKRFLTNKIAKYFPTKTLSNLTINTIYVFLVIVVIFTVLQVLHFEGAVNKALAGAGILALGLSFAFQEIAANFISGVILAFNKPFVVDEIIRVKDFEGFVISVSLKDTTIRTYQEQLITIPNKDIFTNSVTNFTRLGRRRADIRGSVCKSNDLRKVREVTMEALAGVPGIIIENTKFLFREITDDVYIFIAELWLNSGNFDDYRIFINDGIVAIDEAFKANDIAVPNDEYWLSLTDDSKQVLTNLVRKQQ